MPIKTTNLGLPLWPPGLGDEQKRLQFNDAMEIIDGLAPIAAPYAKFDLNGTNQSSLTQNAYNRVAFSRAVTNNIGVFDAANHRITPVKGTYLAFIALTIFPSGTPSGDCQSFVFQNGSALLIGESMSNGSPFGSGATRTASGVIQCNGTTDYIEGYLFAVTGTGVIFGNTTDTYMQIVKLSD